MYHIPTSQYIAKKFVINRTITKSPYLIIMQSILIRLMSKSTIKSMQQFFYPNSYLIISLLCTFISHQLNKRTFTTSCFNLSICYSLTRRTIAQLSRKHNQKLQLVKVLGPFSWICQVTSMSLFSKRCQ